MIPRPGLVELDGKTWHQSRRSRARGVTWESRCLHPLGLNLLSKSVSAVRKSRVSDMGALQTAGICTEAARRREQVAPDTDGPWLLRGATMEK